MQFYYPIKYSGLLRTPPTFSGRLLNALVYAKIAVAHNGLRPRVLSNCSVSVTALLKRQLDALVYARIAVHLAAQLLEEADLLEEVAQGPRIRQKLQCCHLVCTLREWDNDPQFGRSYATEHPTHLLEEAAQCITVHELACMHPTHLLEEAAQRPRVR